MALHSFVTVGAKDLGGEPLWDALEYLAEGFDSCVWDVEHEMERIRRTCIKRMVQRRVRWRRAKR